MNEFTHFVDDFPIFVYKISTRCNPAQNIRGRLVLENNSLKTISEKEAASIETAPLDHLFKTDQITSTRS